MRTFFDAAVAALANELSFILETMFLGDI